MDQHFYVPHMSTQEQSMRHFIQQSATTLLLLLLLLAPPTPTLVSTLIVYCILLQDISYIYHIYSSLCSCVIITDCSSLSVSVHTLFLLLLSYYLIVWTRDVPVTFYLLPSQSHLISRSNTYVNILKKKEINKQVLNSHITV